MSIIELFQRLIFLALVVAAAVFIYRLIWVEPEVRTESERASIRLNRDGGETPSAGVQSTDDCERYINSDQIQSCIEARQQQ